MSELQAFLARTPFSGGLAEASLEAVGAMLLERSFGLDLYQLDRLDVQAYVPVLQDINRELCRAGKRITGIADEAEDERKQIRR